MKRTPEEIAFVSDLAAGFAHEMREKAERAKPAAVVLPDVSLKGDALAESRLARGLPDPRKNIDGEN